MIAAHDPEPLPVAAIGPVADTIAGSGGQGQIRELPAHPHLLLKTYRSDHQPDVGALCALAAWPVGLSSQDRALILARTSWPARVITDTPWGVGTLIQRAPDRFWNLVEGKRIPRDLQFAFVPAARFSGAELLTPAGAITMTYRYASLLDVLHRGGVAYGDLNHSNLLWAGSTSRPEPFLIDCDAAWLTSGPRTLPVAQTPLWLDPWAQRDDGSPGEAVQRDRLKLALLFVRLYYRSLMELDAARPLIELPAEPPITQPVADLLLAGLRRDGERPAAADWLQPLDRLERRVRALAPA